MIIRSFLPNPPGKDQEGEYIELENTGGSPVNLAGWAIRDQGGKEFRMSGPDLEPGARLKIFYSETKIVLNNDGEKIFLFDPAGNLVSELGFGGKAAEGIPVINSESPADLNSGTNEISEAMIEKEVLGAGDFEFNNQAPLHDSLIYMIGAGLILAGIALWILKKAAPESFSRKEAAGDF